MRKAGVATKRKGSGKKASAGDPSRVLPAVNVTSTSQLLQVEQRAAEGKKGGRKAVKKGKSLNESPKTKPKSAAAHVAGRKTGKYGTFCTRLQFVNITKKKQ